MKNSTHFLLCLSLLILTASQSTDPDLTLEQLKNDYQSFQRQYPMEKSYIQLDKPFYKPGETVWFNVFLVDAGTHSPTPVSDVIYAQLIGPRGEIVQKKKLLVDSGSSGGQFDLGSMVGGNFSIQVTTNWMKNFQEEPLFLKEFQVQKVITPRLLLNLDYEREAYRPKELVEAELEVKDLKNNLITDSDVSYFIFKEGIKVFEGNARTNAEGIARISYSLPEDLSTVDVLLQAKVDVAGISESISRSVPVLLNRVDLKFYPEGGDLIQGIPNKLAYKATNEFGKAADIEAYLIDPAGDTLSLSKSVHMGMGSFEFTPKANERYSVKVKNSDGDTFKVPPSFLKYGLRLKENTDSKLVWNIFSPIDGKVILMGHSGGDIIHKKVYKVIKGENQIEIKSQNYPSGVAVFTLFDGTGVEHSERLVFMHPQNGLNLTVESERPEYTPGDEVNLNIYTKNSNNEPVSANLSLSVVDDQIISFADDKQDNIISALLLSSDLKGKIQEPSFYFDSEEENTDEALDHLMLIHGFRRFEWKEIRQPTIDVTYLPDNIRILSGIVVDQNDKPVKAEVILLEATEEKRIDNVKTTDQGEFMFKNIDPRAEILLYTEKPNKIKLNKQGETMLKFAGVTPSQTESEAVVAELIEEEATSDNDTITVRSSQSLNIGLSTDVTELSEVVVTALGVSREKAALGYAVSTVDRTMIDDFSLENALAGRVAGVRVTNASGMPGSASSIIIRGYSSLSPSSNPLYVIDGIPYDESINPNFSVGSHISINNIGSVSILKGSAATSLYGSRGTNGVILITTKRRHYFPRNRRYNSNFNSVFVSPTFYERKREFYEEKQKAEDQISKTNNTIYWNDKVFTNKSGKAKVSFKLGDKVSSFRITAEGITSAGEVGRDESAFATLLPFSIDTKIPNYLSVTDTLRLPVRLTNESSKKITASVNFASDKNIDLLGGSIQSVSIEPKSSKTVFYEIVSDGKPGKSKIHINGTSERFEHTITDSLSIKSIGFPIRLSYSSNDPGANFQIPINDVEKGTFKTSFSIYPNFLSDLSSGMKSMLAEPHGCFEQVSSTTYPNIFVLQYLDETNQLEPSTRNLALKYIKNGYKKLKSYEIKGGGFEWFGNGPAHEGLTAYGLLEFFEMKKIWTGVETSVINRTKNYLMSRRDGRGGFKQAKGKHGFALGGKEITNAYIVWALSETGERGIMKEYLHSYKNQGDDWYVKALLANAAYNLGRTEDYRSLTQDFIEEVNKGNLGNLKAYHSMVRAYGESLQIETTAMWVSALLKNHEANSKGIQECLNYLVSKRNYGRFGSSQSTAMTLRALASYSKVSKSQSGESWVQFLVNETFRNPDFFNRNSNSKIIYEGFESSFNFDGDNYVSIQFDDKKETLPYSFDITYNSLVPRNDPECSLLIKTEMDLENVRVNGLVRQSAQLVNMADTGQPMTILKVGIPAGLQVQPWQLKELKEKGIVDFYEVYDESVVFYFTELGPREFKEVNLDLKAVLAGTYTAPPSSGYLYYQDEYKSWSGGATIQIK